MNPINVIRRIYRKIKGRCYVCGKWVCNYHSDQGWAYCSYECACYDGTFSMRYGVIGKPSVWRGVCVPPKNRSLP